MTKSALLCTTHSTVRAQHHTRHRTDHTHDSQNAHRAEAEQVQPHALHLFLRLPAASLWLGVA